MMELLSHEKVVGFVRLEGERQRRIEGFLHIFFF